MEQEVSTVGSTDWLLETGADVVEWLGGALFGGDQGGSSKQAADVLRLPPDQAWAAIRQSTANWTKPLTVGTAQLLFAWKSAYAADLGWPMAADPHRDQFKQSYPQLGPWSDSLPWYGWAAVGIGVSVAAVLILRRWRG